MTEEKQFSIGVDIGGTTIKLGEVSNDGKIVKKIAVDTLAQEGPDTVIHQIKNGINTLLFGTKNEIKGIGIGAPGMVKLNKGIVQNPPNLPGWDSVPLGEILEKEFKMNVFVENDANNAAIGEKIFGAAKNLNSFIMITLGTGVGSGVFIDNKIYRGDTGAGAEIGHVSIDYNGRKCNCGSIGCIEAYAGNNYLIKDVKQKLNKHRESKIWDLIDAKKSNLTPKIIHDACEMEDEFACSIVTELGNHLGYALSTAVNMLDITDILIGGGVAGFGKLLFNAAENTAKERTLTPFKKRIKIKPAKLKNDAGIKGASALVFYHI